MIAGEGFEADLGPAAPAHLEVPYEKPYDQQNDHASRGDICVISTTSFTAHQIGVYVPALQQMSGNHFTSDFAGTIIVSYSHSLQQT